MPTFNANGHDWSIRFDGLLLSELREAHGINLADVTGEAYLKLELDQATLVRSVCFLCRDQLAAKQMQTKVLADALCGETAEAALQAVWGAAKNFFRPKLWSALQSAYETQKQMAELRPMMNMLDSLPAGMREAVMEQMAAKMEAMSGISSPPSEEQPSATGLAVNQLKPATDSQEPAVLAPAA